MTKQLKNKLTHCIVPTRTEVNVFKA